MQVSGSLVVVQTRQDSRGPKCRCGPLQRGLCPACLLAVAPPRGSIGGRTLMTLALRTRPGVGCSDMARSLGLPVRLAGTEVGVELVPLV